MDTIHMVLGEETAVFSWKDGRVYAEGYDLESERNVLAMTRFGKGIGVLLVAMNSCCKNEDEFMAEVETFAAVHAEIPCKHYESCPGGQLSFEYLSYSPDPELRWRWLERARLSERHYKRLLADPEVEAQRAMARFMVSPKKYFYLLLELSRFDVNSSLARNKNCPSEILEILAKGDNAVVRQDVASNSGCPDKLLELLVQDQNFSGSMAARKHIERKAGIEV